MQNVGKLSKMRPCNRKCRRAHLLPESGYRISISNEHAIRGIRNRLASSGYICRSKRLNSGTRIIPITQPSRVLRIVISRSCSWNASKTSADGGCIILVCECEGTDSLLWVPRQPAQSRHSIEDGTSQGLDCFDRS